MSWRMRGTRRAVTSFTMKLRSLSFLSVIALAFAAGYSSSVSDPAADDAEGALGLREGESLSGAFSVALAGKTVKFAFTMDQIDLRAKTVRWNAHITDRGGNAQATDDKNEAGEIIAVARCPGCFTASIPGPSGKLALVVVSDSKVASIKYEGIDARLITAAAGAPTAAGGGDGAESPDDRGVCKLNGGNCKELARSECKAGPLYPTMRCCMNFTFEEGADCN